MKGVPTAFSRGKGAPTAFSRGRVRFSRGTGADSFSRGTGGPDSFLEVGLLVEVRGPRQLLVEVRGANSF